ncbi:MAG: PCRF domain-containing protein, partial [Polaribacter sp.]
MLEKIRIVKQRFDEVSDLIIQPEIISDQKRYAQLMKEYKDLGDVVRKGEQYQLTTNNIEEAKEIISDGTDAEMVEMAKMQLDEATTKISKLEDEIKLMLIPKDP